MSLSVWTPQIKCSSRMWSSSSTQQHYHTHLSYNVGNRLTRSCWTQGNNENLCPCQWYQLPRIHVWCFPLSIQMWQYLEKPARNQLMHSYMMTLSSRTPTSQNETCHWRVFSLGICQLVCSVRCVCFEFCLYLKTRARSTGCFTPDQAAFCLLAMVFFST